MKVIYIIALISTIDGLNIHSAGNITIPETGLYSLSAYINPTIPARKGDALWISPIILNL